MTDQDYAAQVDERAQQLLQGCCDRRAHLSMWSFHAAFACGGDQGELIEGESIEGELIEMAGREYEPGPFNIYPGIVLLNRWEDRMPTAAVESIKSMFFDSWQQRGNTENHWLMYYVGNLLAAERWPHEPKMWNGLPPAAMQAEASRWILGMIRRTATIGHYEYDSTGYHTEHFIPYLALAEQAADPYMRRQALQMVQLLLADMALEYFHGAYAGGHGREGNVNTWTQVGPGQALNYLYFGDEEFEPERHCQTYATFASAASFRPPAVLAAIALDRQTPHAVCKTKPPRAIYRHVEHEPEPVHKYTWMSRSFALGSTQTGLPGPPAAPIDLTSWDLTWRGPRHQAKICCNHPYRSYRRFSAFLPDLPQRVGRHVATGKPHMQVADRLFGASPYEYMMQHEGALIVLYRIPPDDETPYVNCFLPKGHLWSEQDGWLLGDLGDFYVGLRPIGDYQWQDVHESGKDGNWLHGWLLRIQDLHAGLLLEAGESQDFESFEDFCRQRTQSQVELQGWPQGGRVSMQTCAGVTLELDVDGEHRIDGTPIDYEGYPLFDGPGVTAPLNSGRSSFRHTDQVLELDFEIDPDSPALPMRVIG